MDGAAAATIPAPALRRAVAFVRERFPPGVYALLIGAFVACGSVAASTSSGRAVSLGAAALAAVVVTLAFLRMRLLDEIKDLPVDRLGRPSRPLPRGLVAVRELRGAAWLALAGMTLAAALLGPVSFTVYAVAAAFLVGAGVDFGVGSRVEPRPFLYALLHSPAVPLLLAFTWFAQPGATADARLAWLVVAAWGTGLGAELGRKTVAPSEERPFVPTYSGHVGQSRAALLTALALATGALGVAGYSAAAGFSVPALLALLAGAAAILASWPWLRRARGRTLELWSGAVALLVLLAPSLLSLRWA